MPAIRSGDVDRNQMAGMWPGEDWEEGRSVTVEMRRLGCDDALDAVDELSEVVASQQSEGELLINDEWTLFCRPRRRDLRQEERFGPVLNATVQWEATDPRIYGVEQVAQATLVNADDYGRDYPREHPWMYEGSGRHSMILAHNTGRRPSWRIKARIFGPCLDPGLRLVRQQLLLRFAIELEPGQVLDVDFWRGSVELAGSTRYLALTPTSTWWGLAPQNSNPVRFIAARYDREARLELRWRSAW
jgi:hypothetical protein